LQGVKGVADPAHPDNIIFDITPNADGTGGTGQAPTARAGSATALAASAIRSV